jgi:hypothetical protein
MGPSEKNVKDFWAGLESIDFKLGHSSVKAAVFKWDFRDVL